MAAVTGAATGADAGDGGSGPAALDIENIERRVERSLVGKIQRLTEDFPDRALEVIRGWMAAR